MVLDELEAGLPPMWEHLQIGNGGSSNSRDGSNEAIISSTFLKVSKGQIFKSDRDPGLYLRSSAMTCD